MIDARKIARLILLGLAIYFMLELGRLLIITLPGRFLYFDISGAKHPILSLITPMSCIIYLAVLSYLIVSKADYWAEKMVSTPARDNTEAKISWVPFAFRLTAVLTGAIYLYRVLWVVMLEISRYLNIKAWASESARIEHPFQIDKVITWLVMAAFALYLVCGAPHFVRWQVRKTIEFCREFEEQKTDKAEKPLTE